MLSALGMFILPVYFYIIRTHALALGLNEMSSKALVKHLKMTPEVIACLLCGGLLVLLCAVLYRINLLNSLVGRSKKSPRVMWTLSQSGTGQQCKRV